MNRSLCLLRAKWRVLAAAAAGLSLFCSSAHASFGFLGVAAGDVSPNEVTLWTRGVDASAPAAALLTLQVSTDPAFATNVMTVSDTTVPAKDYTLKITATGLQAGTQYYYRFVGPSLELSNLGKFKTAPAASANYPLHFAFSGDYDGLMRPYTLGNNFTANSFDFFMNVGDTIYETASTGSLPVAATGSFGAGLPTGSAGASPALLYGDFTRKYREQFIAINIGGQNCLQDFFAAQGNYTLLDNHELGNKQYMHGGAAAGGAVGGSVSGAGVDPANASNDVNTSGTFINKTPGFAALISAYTDYQPIKNRGLISAPADLRTDGTQQLYLSQQWGRNAVLINTDTRSYRDIRLRTAGNVDDTGTRADNPNRTYLGATQLAWLEQQLLTAEQNGTTWKFVAISDPIDQIGPISGALSGVTSATMQPYSGNASYVPVSADGGKALMGGYRAERNALLKFIADHQIKNVVFLATDDHQNRVNEILYSPTGQTSLQSSYVKVPYCFEIVDGPFGATGPDLFLNHDWASVQGSANLIANAQAAAGLDPIGLMGYPGLHNVQRDQTGVLVNEATPQAADFYSPDTFNYNTIDLSADGKTLTVKSIGINSYAQNNRVEANTGNQAGNTPRTILSFQIDAASPLNNIDHIIVVYQENWSFDALYGNFPGANGLANASAASLNQIDRLSGSSLATLTGIFNVATRTSPTLNAPWPQPINTNSGNIVDARFPTTLDTLLPYDLNAYLQTTDQTGDIVHKYWQEQFQVDGSYLSGGSDFVTGNNQGFVTWSDNPGLVMSRFDASNLPEGLLAQQYTMCDNFFHSAFGGSFLNHQFLIAAAAPVYLNMPAANNGTIAYLDGAGLFTLNASGSSTGKVIRDGSITPVVGDLLTGLTINGVSGQSATVGASGAPSDIAYLDGSHFTQHYVVNTTFTANLCPTFSTFGSVGLMPSLNNTNPAGAGFTQNIGDLLDNAGVSWKWYSGGWNNALDSSKSNPLHPGTSGPNTVDPLFQWHHQAFAYFDKSKPFDGTQGDGRNPYATAHIQDEANLYTDITNSTLPSVSFVKFLGPDNEHPGYTSVQRGQQHVADLVTAVQANPSLWAHTLIVITYDEHGGRWDHVTPPVRDIWGPGVRVPTIMISPFAKRGFVDHTQYDTSSILATIEQRFGLPSLNQRDANAPGLLGSLTNLQVTRGALSLNRRISRMVQSVTVTNAGSVPIVGPISLVIDNISANTSVTNATGTVANNAPTGSPYISVTANGLVPGASATVSLQFTPPASGVITYTARTITGASAP